MIYIRWILYLIPSFIITFICWISNPIACLFPSRQPNGRDKLWGIFELWSTYDNPVDEFYYGHYADEMISKPAYDNSGIWRYWYRLRWLTRNTGYGFSYKLLSIPKGAGFQWKGQTKPFLGYYNDFNIGWKSHKGFDRDDYAARIIGLRKA